MQSNYSNREFEQYVKQHADEYRMFPSEKVWKGVHNSLHTRRRWSGLGLAFLLLLTGGAVTWVMTIYPSSKKQDITSIRQTPIATTPADEPASTPASSRNNGMQDLMPFSQPGEDFSSTPFDGSATEDIDIAETNALASLFSTAPVAAPEGARIERENARTIINNSAVAFQELPAGLIINPPAPAGSTEYTSTEQQKANPAEYPLLTIESIANAYKYKKAPKRVSWQLFVTPTISYRKLSVNNSVDNSGVGYPFASLTDVNKAVTHKPDLGLQIGINARYPLGNAIKLRGGLQFNINRYDIKAFAYNGEVATINLNDGSPGNNSISTWTRYRNYNGYHSDWLKNYYFSVSLPVGAEITLLGNKKTSLGVAGTIQPTYIISDRAYLISTDYKNYAKVPWLIRSVNVSTGFETFVSYTKGKMQWQIGPQVRYQLLSSFHNQYPVKENLFDFGVKVGVSVIK